MKKVFLIACFCAFAFTTFAQEDKAPLTKSLSENFRAYTTGLNLLQFGYATSSPSSLIEAARIIASVPVAPGNFECLDNDKVEGEKEVKISFDPRKILEDAMAMAGNDKTLKNLAKVVNSEHTHPEKRPPFRGITTQNTSIFIEKGVRIREIAQVFRSNATQPLSIAF